MEEGLVEGLVRIAEESDGCEEVYEMSASWGHFTDESDDKLRMRLVEGASEGILVCDLVRS